LGGEQLVFLIINGKIDKSFRFDWKGDAPGRAKKVSPVPRAPRVLQAAIMN
jgi:hypothetical protein